MNKTKKYPYRMILVGLLTLVMIVTQSCATPTPQPAVTQAPQPTATEAPKLSDKLYLLNWSDYMDPQIVEGFKKEFGVELVVDSISSSEDILSKLQTSPNTYDLIFPSDYMVESLINQGLLEVIDLNNVPNIKNLSAFFQKPAYDPEGKYSVIYDYGTTGLAYNSKYVDPAPDSWAVLWDTKYKGKVAVLDSIRDAMSMSLMYKGYSANSTTEAEVKVAAEALIELKPNLVGFVSTGMEDMLASEEVYLMHVWSGRALRAQTKNPNVQYVIPKEGALVWADTMAIPIGAPHKYTAEVLINYLLRPEISNMTGHFLKYGTGNAAALEIADKDYRENTIINLPEDVLSKLTWAKDLGTFRDMYDKLWTEVKATQ
jgi:spermidine/putrescine transport system substrate-binding protein